jgi:carbon-monoxide dehydrogenase small subunit
MSTRDPSRSVTVSCTVNGVAVEETVPARLPLSDLLREHLYLTGTKLGCEQGACGACTVLVDGLAMRACLMLAAQAEGTDITTVEGLGERPGLSALQRSFQEHHALQCGFCTPGMLMMATELLAEPGPLDEQTVRRGLAGNLCRCTGYETIVDAVMAVARGPEARDG